jgi:DNA-binding HxlR family transcriptional regulator
MPGARSYDDPCGIARGLDVVGERWALLVVRELVFSPKRFNDLRRGLGGVSPNVLSQRLADLEEAGVVERRVAGPPVGATVYALTASGRQLVPVLDALARWGRQLPIRSERPLSRDALMLALQTSVSADADTRPGLRVRLDGSDWDPVVSHGVLEWQPPVGPAEATLTTSSATLHQLVFRGLDLGTAVTTGQVTVHGDASLVTAFLAAFEQSALLRRPG